MRGRESERAREGESEKEREREREREEKAREREIQQAYITEVILALWDSSHSCECCKGKVCERYRERSFECCKGKVCERDRERSPSLCGLKAHVLHAAKGYCEVSSQVCSVA